MGADVNFSIIIPTHNRPIQLERAVQSVISQLAPGSELIVVDDGSSECYSEVLSRIRHLLSHYIVCSNSAGVAAARNVGMAAASNDWIVFLDDDDEFSVDYLKQLEAAIARNQFDQNRFYWSEVLTLEYDAHGAVASQRATVLSKKMSSVKQAEVTTTMAGASYGFALHRTAIARAGSFDVGMRRGEDTEYFIRLMSCGVVSTIVPVVGVIKHNHCNERLSAQADIYSKDLVYEQILERHAGYMASNKLLKASMLQYGAYLHFMSGRITAGNRLLRQTIGMELLSAGNLMRYLYLLIFRLNRIRVASRVGATRA